MVYPATTEAQKRKVIDWIASGFERYASRAPDFERPTSRSEPEVLRYSEEFAEILYGNIDDNELDLPQLRQDLLRLIDARCPPLDVVELMVHCTSEFNVALARGMHRFNITERDLSDLSSCYRQAAEVISRLGRSGIPGPSLFAPDFLPEDVQQARRQLREMSECAASIAERLRDHRPADIFPWANAFLKDGAVSYFYTLLKYFRCGYPTLSRLLKAMRRCRQIVDRETESVRTLNCKSINSSSIVSDNESPEGKVHDPFSPGALQRRMNRFLKVDAGWTDGYKKCVQFYYSDECISLREGGGTLMQFLDRVPEQLVRGCRHRKRANSQSTRNIYTMPKGKRISGHLATATGIFPVSNADQSASKGKLSRAERRRNRVLTG
jgi:hypothetical protein